MVKSLVANRFSIIEYKAIFGHKYYTLQSQPFTPLSLLRSRSISLVPFKSHV